MPIGLVLRGRGQHGNVAIYGASAPPAAPAITSPADGSYNTTGSLTLSGTISGSPSGASVTLYDGATQVGTATPDSGGDWSVPLSDVSDATHTYTATETLSGLTSAASPAVHVTVDTDSPTLNLPSDQTVDATSPTGAVVSFSAGGTDDVQGQIAATCTPSSGSTFAIGTTTVNCSTTDAAGNTTAGSFTVTVKGASAQLTDLQAAVQGVGPGMSLSAKAQAAQSDLAAGDISGACSTLAAFINEVHAQSGKTIPASEAAQLIADATQIATVIGC